MGLISRALTVSQERVEDSQIQLVHEIAGEAKKKSGLLSKIALSSSFDIVSASYSALMNELGYERGGVLFADDSERASMLFSCGYDYTTVSRFIPLVAQITNCLGFGDSIVVHPTQMDTWQSFFSYHELSSLQSLTIRKVSTNDSIACYLVLSESLLDARRDYHGVDPTSDCYKAFQSAIIENIPLLKALSHAESVNKSLEAMRSHAKSALAAKKTASFLTVSCDKMYEDEMSFHTDHAVQSLYKAIVHQIARLAGSTNIVFADGSGTVKVVLFTSVPTDVVFYAVQLMKPLERLFGLERMRRVTVTESGTSTTLSEIMGFLTGAA